MKQESIINNFFQQFIRITEDDSLQNTPHSQKQKLSKEEFIQQLQAVTEANSLQSVHYSHIRVEGGKIQGIRNSTQKSFEIDIDALYQAYKENETINTSILKRYVDRVQSPAYAILIKMGLLK